jgi:hypothetical protein
MRNAATGQRRTWRAGRAATTAAGPREYTVREIPGTVAEGQQWKDILEADGNNADGIIATRDGGLLIAQNEGSNTGGSLATSSKNTLFIPNRGLNPSIDELAPKRKMLANRCHDDPLDCIGGVLNWLDASGF